MEGENELGMSIALWLGGKGVGEMEGKETIR